MEITRKICVVTTTRADYGLLYWLLREVANDPELHLQLVVSGSHLSRHHGYTKAVIEADGFHADAEVEMLIDGDSTTSIATSMGIGLMGFAAAFARLQPDIVVVLGDRFEILAAAEAAFVLRIPIAHIHGGELTLGALDDGFRHAVTKLSQLHFVAAEPYRKRVIQMGEDPRRVFNVGAPGLDYIKRVQLLSRDETEQLLGLRLRQPVFLIAYHPETRSDTSPSTGVAELLAALDEFPQASLVFTMPNADEGNQVIREQIARYVERNAERAVAHMSLGQIGYLNAIRHADVVVGNSSSGIYEVPVFRKPTVNVGDRQKGRLRPASVIDCPVRRDAIAAAIRRALSDEFRASLQGVELPHGDGDASRRIKDILKQVSLQGLLDKSFYDIDFDPPSWTDDK